MTPGARHLPRVLSFFDFSVLSSAAMGPAYSLASTAGVMIAGAGALAPAALLLQTGVMVCIAIGFARLAGVAPNAGSSYAWVRSAFGERAGAYAAWLLILANYFATMATALPAGTYTLQLVAPHLANVPLWNAIIGCAWIVGCAAVLYLGARPTARVTAIMLLAEVVVLLAVAAASVLAGAAAHGATRTPGALPAAGPAVTPWGFLGASVLAIWMIDGWEVSAATSEESRGSSRSAGAGGLWGLLATAALLLGCMQCFIYGFSAGDLAGHQADILAFIGRRLGPAWAFTLVATVLVSTAATLSTTMLYLSRSLFAMGRDGVLPRALGRLDRRGDPTLALAAMTAGVIISTLLTGLSASAAAALQFVLGGSAVFLGGLFVLSALAAAKRFWHARGADRRSGVVLPLAGAAALFGMLLATTLGSDAVLRTTVLAGLALGLPFALWRGRANVPISG